MYEVNKCKDYKAFAKLLEKNTECSVKIQIVGNDHIHYQLNDRYDMTLGVLCVNKGDVSFAPFVTFETAEDEQYINVQYMPQFEDFARVLGVFRQMFVVTE